MSKNRFLWCITPGAAKSRESSDNNILCSLHSHAVPYQPSQAARSRGFDADGSTFKALLFCKILQLEFFLDCNLCPRLRELFMQNRFLTYYCNCNYHDECCCSRHHSLPSISQGSLVQYIFREDPAFRNDQQQTTSNPSSPYCRKLTCHQSPNTKLIFLG